MDTEGENIEYCEKHEHLFANKPRNKNGDHIVGIHYGKCIYCIMTQELIRNGYHIHDAWHEEYDS